MIRARYEEAAAVLAAVVVLASNHPFCGTDCVTLINL